MTSESRPTFATPEQLLVLLDELGLESTTHDHAAVFTVEESKALRGDIPGAHCKNLFLRNKKGRMWLAVCPEGLRLDLKALGAAIGAGRLSFASAERLQQHLGVTPGSVTPFAVVNDREGNVPVVLVESLLEEELLNFHPLINSRTTTLSPEALLTFLRALDHEPKIVRDTETSRDD
ncbi:MAG: prolyl-tRNA synthetase associated domain-containing protein [Acidobacteriota bacterium]